MDVNREDIERGQELLSAGEPVRYDELRLWDRIIGVGIVTAIQSIGREGVLVRTEPSPGTDGIPTESIHHAEAKVAVERGNVKQLAAERAAEALDRYAQACWLAGDVREAEEAEEAAVEWRETAAAQ